MARYRKNSAEIIYTDKWRGLDMSREEKKNFSSSVYMKNFAVTEKYDLKKRCGYRKTVSGLDCDSCFYATIGGIGYFIYKSGKKLYALKMTDMSSIEYDTGSFATVGYFVFGGEAYIYGNGLYCKFDGNSFSVISPYVPTVAITCSPSGQGTLYESLNVLCEKAKISYSPDGTSTVFTLPADAQSVDTVEIDGQVVAAGYTYDASAHTLTFTTAPTGGVPDSLTVTFTLSDETILNMPYIGNKFCIYGGGRDTRVFAYGNKNTLYYSDVTANGADATYFPADNFITVGDGGTVTALIRHYDRLIVFKETETWFLSPSSVDYDGYSKPSYPLSPLNSTVGCAGGGAVYADNSPFTLSYDGIYVFGQSTVRDERNAKRVSDRIAPYLTPAFLRHAVVYDYEYGKEIWMCYGGAVIVYNYGNDAFYVYDNIPAEYFFVHEGKLSFYSGGVIYAFDESASDDDGVPVTAVAESGYVILDKTVKKRRLRRISLSYLPAKNSEVTVKAEANRGGGKSAVFSWAAVSGFDFGLIDFTDFCFYCCEIPLHSERRVNLSSFEGLKLCITCTGGRTAVSGVSLYVDGA